MRKHQIEADSAEDSRFWEAHWELMDMAEGHWIQSAGLNIGLQPSAAWGIREPPRLKPNVIRE